MMILECFSVHDGAVNLFMAPFFMRAKGEAIRSLRDTVADKNTMLSRHPQDYVLYHLGTFYEAQGRFELHAEPVVVVRAIDLVE